MISFSTWTVSVVLALAGTAKAPNAEDFHTLRVGVVVYDGVEMLDFSGPVEVFAAAAGRLSIEGQPLFEVVLVAPYAGTVHAHGGAALQPRFTIADCPPLDVIVLPGGETASMSDDPAFLDWLRAASPHARIVMSVCNAAFVLAKLGMLDGLEATTYHGFLGFLRNDSPKVRVLADRRVVDNGHIVTTGGVACGIDGALHVVARLGGRRMVDSIATYLEYPWTPEPALAPSYPEWSAVGGEPAQLRQQLVWHRSRRDQATVIKTARALTEAEPDDGIVWYQLCSALLADGDLDEAIAAGEESAKRPGFRSRALYSVACAWARQNDREKALGALERATAAGFSDRPTAEKDRDLAALRDDPRFAALVERIGAQGTPGRPEWAAAVLLHAREVNEAGFPDDELQMLANGLGDAPQSEPVRTALEQALARADANTKASGKPNDIALQAHRTLNAHPRPVPAAQLATPPAGNASQSPPAPVPAPPPATASSPTGPCRVALVLFDDVVLLELTGPARILDAVPGFSTYTVAATRDPVKTDLATITPDYTFADAPPPDVILISSGSGGLHDAALRDWLRANGPRAQAVISVCNGALVLANAGLLDGRQVTCPFGNFDGLWLLGKDVSPLRARRFVRDGNIVTCDSYFAGVDGALEAVRYLRGDAAAQSAASSNFYEWQPRAAPKDQAPSPPTHRMAILKTLLARGPDAALAEYQQWLTNAAREESARPDPARECLAFQILAWTLEGAGRTDDAIALCEWATLAFPDSVLALACVGQAYFAAGRYEDALPALIRADEKAHGDSRALEYLAAVLHHPEHVASEDSQRARRILRERASECWATLVPSGEPGERLLISGVVRDADGRPLPNASVYVFHADASGHYTTGAAMDEPNARLFAFLRTDAEGRYSFTTVRPGGYPEPRKDVAVDAEDERWIPQHIHYEVESAGHAPRRFQLVFADDPRMTPHWQTWAKEGGHPIVTVTRDGAGTWRGSCDVTLK